MTADTYQQTQHDNQQLSEVMLQVIAFTVLTLCGLLMYFLMADSSTSLLPAATSATFAKEAKPAPTESTGSTARGLPIAVDPVATSDTAKIRVTSIDQEAVLAATPTVGSSGLTTDIQATLSAVPNTVPAAAAEPAIKKVPSAPLPVTAPITPPAATVVTATGAAASTTATATPVVAPTPLEQPLLDSAVYFDFASFELSADAKTTLDGFAAKLQDNPTSTLVLTGHTDARGSPDANAELSAARAQACQNYLIAAGVDATRMGYAGLGARRPRASNATATGRAENRRVDLMVVR